MSTRSTIQFHYRNLKATIYKHFDGYPTNMIPLLQEFLAWNKDRNTNPGYAAANFCFWAKFKELEESARESITEKENPDPREVGRAIFTKFICAEHCLTGFGVTNNDHNDEEWFYRIDAEKEIIHVTTGSRDRKFRVGFTAKKSKKQLEKLENSED